MPVMTKTSRELCELAEQCGWQVKQTPQGASATITNNGLSHLIKIAPSLNAGAAKSLRNQINRYATAAPPKPRPKPKPVQPPLVPATPKESTVVMTKIKGSDEDQTFRAEVMEITPELAMDWLTDPKYKAPNRTLRRTKIATYVDSMRRGQWRVTGEAIKFDKEGRLIDGQHRLNAIVDSGVTIRSLVITGLEPDTQDVMDTGAARDAKDVLTIHGIRHASVVAAAARIMVAHEAGRFLPGQETARASNDEVLEFAATHPELADLYAACQLDLRRSPLRGALGLAALYMMSQVDREEAMDFFNRLGQGHQLETNSPILALRQRLYLIEMNKERHSPYTIVSVLLRTFNSWRKGEKLARVILYRDDRPVLIPEPWAQ